MFTESPRYYNRLLDAWENRYGGKRREEGIAYLRSLCENKIHLQVPPITVQKVRIFINVFFFKNFFSLIFFKTLFYNNYLLLFKINLTLLT